MKIEISDIQKKYEVKSYRHASAILSADFPQEYDDILSVLDKLVIADNDIQSGGGNKSAISKQLEQEFKKRKWLIDRSFANINSHKIDCVKNRVGIEVEWNNKDTFFDRDILSFGQMFHDDVLSVGVIITRSDLLQEYCANLGKKMAFGASTTHMSKLTQKLQLNRAHGCPILVFGITPNVIQQAIRIAPVKKTVQVTMADFYA
jgi:hypothetical protein